MQQAQEQIEQGHGPDGLRPRSAAPSSTSSDTRFQEKAKTILRFGYLVPLGSDTSRCQSAPQGSATKWGPEPRTPRSRR